MKDEEMAEEYANSVIGCGDGYYEWTDVFDGFLAGLKAGRPQWHDLRKDPNDLPVLETELLCQKSSGRCFVGYYKHTDEKFHSYETGKSYDIVRWMDIGIWWNIPKV